MSAHVQGEEFAKPRKRVASWILLGAGLGVLVPVFVLDGALDRAIAQGHLSGGLLAARGVVVPLLVLSLCLFGGAPLATTLPPSKKYAAVFAAVIAWLIFLFSGAAVLFFLLGSGSD